MSTFVQSFQISPSATSLLSEEADIQAKLDNIRSRLKDERIQCIPQLRQLIAKFGFTQDEIFPKPEMKAAVADKDYSPEYFYRDPVTKEEWDGKGKRPAFLARKKKTDEFRVYHATGTKSAPVVKATPTKAEPATLDAVLTAMSAIASLPESQPASIISTVSDQSVVASTPIIPDHSASALPSNASAKAVPIPS